MKIFRSFVIFFDKKNITKLFNKLYIKYKA